MIGFTFCKRRASYVWLWIALLVPLQVSALPVLFPIDPADISLNFLTFIFGEAVTSGPNGVPNATMLIIHNFINCCLPVAVLISTVATFQGVLAGSHLGEIVREGSPGKILTKQMIGLSLLMPDPHGYAFIQKILFWLVLNGVGLANEVWGAVYHNFALGNSTFHSKISSEVVEITKNLFTLASAIALAESKSSNTYFDYKSVNNGYTVICDHVSSDCAKEYLGYLNVLNITQPKEVDISAGDLNMILFSMVQQMKQENIIRYGLINEFFSDGGTFDSMSKSLIDFYGASYCQAIFNGYAKELNTVLSLYAHPTTSFISKKLSEGWLGGAFYYWEFSQKSEANANVHGSAKTVVKAYSMHGVNNRVFGGSSYTDQHSQYTVPIATYITALAGVASDADITNPVLKGIMDGGMKKIFQATAFNWVIQDMIPDPSSFYKYDYNFSEDRFLAFVISNNGVISNVLNFVQTILILLSSMIFSGMFSNSGTSPIWYMFIHVAFTIILLFIPFLVTLTSVAVMGGVYAPLVPGLIFAAGAMSWVIRVIEVVVAGPVIALNTMFVQKDELTILQQFISNLLAVILKPAFMVVGFVIAARFCQLSIMFIGNAYNHLASMLVGVSSDNMLMIVFMYTFTTSTTVAVISRAFNLINTLSDQVFLALGVHSADQEAQEMLGQFEDAARKAASAFGEVLSTVGSLGKSMSKIIGKMKSK